MAKDKKSFILYLDQKGIFEKLTNEQSGVLIKHIFSYVSDESPEGDFVTELAFESIKNQLKRDLKKFEEVKTKRSKAGKRSAELRALKKNEQTLTNPTSVENDSTNSTSVKCVQQTSTNPTVTVNDTDTVINNKLFNSKILKDNSYIEVTAMQTKTNKETIEKYIKIFEAHLIRTQEQKKTLKDYKTHFTNWLNLQKIVKVDNKLSFKNPYPGHYTPLNK